MTTTQLESRTTKFVNWQFDQMLSACLRTKWLWVRVQLQSLIIFTINKPNIMKKSKYFHCFTVSILVPYAIKFSYKQNIVTILISPTFRGAVLIRGAALIKERRLFQCGYPKVQHLLEGGTYLRPCTY